MGLLKLLLKFLYLACLSFDQFVFGIELRSVLNTLFFEELNAAILFKEFLFDTRNLIEEFFVLLLLMHNRV